MLDAHCSAHVHVPLAHSNEHRIVSLHLPTQGLQKTARRTEASLSALLQALKDRAIRAGPGHGLKCLELCAALAEGEGKQQDRDLQKDVQRAPEIYKSWDRAPEPSTPMYFQVPHSSQRWSVFVQEGRGLMSSTSELIFFGVHLF
jgi:hypothetical protein